MHLAAIGKHWCIAIDHHCIRLPRIPQPRHQLRELIRDLVAFIMIWLADMAVVLRGAIIAAGDAVPTDAPFSHVVQRIYQSRQQERWIFCYGKRWDQAEVLSCLREIWH